MKRKVKMKKKRKRKRKEKMKKKTKEKPKKKKERKRKRKEKKEKGKRKRKKKKKKEIQILEIHHYVELFKSQTIKAEQHLVVIFTMFCSLFQIVISFFERINMHLKENFLRNGKKLIQI